MLTVNEKAGLPPHNSEAERRVLVALFRNPRSLVRIADRLKPNHFYNDDLGEVYSCALALYANKRLPTIQNLADELARRGNALALDGEGHRDPEGLVWRLTKTIDEMLHHSIEDYAEIVIRDSLLRRLGYAGEEIYQEAMSGKDNALESAEQKIAAIAFDGDMKEGAQFEDALTRYQANYEQRRTDAQAGKIIGVRTGLRAVDWLLGGFRPRCLYIVAARTSVGKTSLALQMGLNVAKRALQDKQEVALFSLEMQEDELVQRILAVETHHDQSLLADGLTNEDQHRDVLFKIQELKSAKMTIFDSVYRLDAIKTNARVLCQRRKVGLIIVDYLQLVDVPPAERGRQKQRYEEIGEISKGLKRMAQELNVPVLALCQMNREGGKSGAPELHHLGESGKLENDADMVAFIHCDDDNLEKRSRSEKYKLDFIVKKHRNRRLGQVELAFDPQLTRFDDMIAED